jgi:4-amino-4-deoxy-L-arabinose transferase-like glycosyltransferase
MGPPMSLSVQVTIVVLVVLGYLLSPIMLIWGWARWARLPKQRRVAAVLSLVGFILASASALLAVSSISYAHDRIVGEMGMFRQQIGFNKCTVA